VGSGTEVIGIGDRKGEKSVKDMGMIGGDGAEKGGVLTSIYPFQLFFVNLTDLSASEKSFTLYVELHFIQIDSSRLI